MASPMAVAASQRGSSPATMTASISQPTLIVASASDGAVSLTHAECLQHSIVNARLKIADSTSHFLWFGPGSAEISDAIRSFLSDAHPGSNP